MQVVIQLGIGDEGLLARDLVFVLARQDGVHRRGVVAVEIVVEKLLLRVDIGDDRAVGPGAVHQVRGIGVARRQGGRRGLSVGLVAHVAGVDGHLGVLVQLLGQRDAALILLVSRVEDHALLVGHRKRNGILGLLRASGHREVVHVDGRVAEELVLPVDPLPHPLVVFERAVEVVQIGVNARRLALDLVHDEIVGVHHVHLLGHGLESVGSRVGDDGLALHTLFRLDDDDAVGAAGSVDGRRRSVFQHRDRGDVRRVDGGVREVLDRESVDDVERCVALGERIGAADDDVHFGSGLSVGRRDRDSGQASLESLIEVHDRGFHQILHLHAAQRSGDVFAGLSAVTDFDDDFVDGAGRLFEGDVDARAVVYGDLLFGVAQQREYQHVARRRLDGVAAVAERGRSAGRSLYEDDGSGDGLFARIGHLAFDFARCLGR